jgi:DHA2 family multidrug resistance protein-like MFS transporter
LLGGVVLEFFWWGAAFLVSVPVMGLLLVLGPRLLPEYRDPTAGRPDLPSAVISLLAVLAMIFGLKQFAQDGAGWVPILAVAAGLALGVTFVRRQRRLHDPLIDLRLFSIPSFNAALAMYGLGILVVFGGFLFIPQFLQLVLGLSPLEAGLWMLPWALGFVLGSMLTPRLARLVPPWTLMAGGCVLSAIGFLVFTQLDAGSGFATIVVGSVLFSLGTGPVFTLTNDLIIGSAPAERAGAAAGVSETAAELGGALGIAFFGSIGIAIYRSQIAERVPEGVPAAAADVARDTLGGAVEVAGQLGDGTGSALVDAARDAFVSGLRVSAVISVVGTLGLALLATLLLRRIGRPPEHEEPLAADAALEHAPS